MRIVIITLSFLLMDFCALKFWLQAPAQLLKPFYEQSVEATGYIEPLTVQQSSQGISFILTCQQLKIEHKSIKYKDKLRITCKTIEKLPKAGKVIVKGRLKELRSFANPGGFNMDDYNWVQGIGGLVLGTELHLVEKEVRLGDNFLLLNLRLRALMEKSVPIEVAALLNGMVLGGSKGLDEEIRESFAANGISHLLSVSGTHLMLLACFLRALIKPLALPKQGLLIAMLLFLYACICSFRPPIIRALGMSLILLWGQGDTPARGKLLCCLMMVLLIFKPIWLLDLGFQLSFGASAGLVWLLPKIKEKLEKLLGYDNFVTESLAVTLAAQVLTIPVLVHNFYTLSLVSILSNLLLVPILELATLLSLMGMLVSLIFTGIGGVFFQVAAWLIKQILQQAQWLRQLPFATFIIGEPPLLCSLLYYLLVFCWFDFSWYAFFDKKQRRMIKCGCMVMLLCCYLWPQIKYKPVTCYFVDVGQGDAAIITTANKTIVIDSGGLAGIDTGARILVPMLHSLGRKQVDLFFASHGDYDHIGGSVGLARNMPIKHIVLPKERFREDELSSLRKLLALSKGSKVEYADARKAYRLDEALIQVVSVPEQTMEGNDASTLLALSSLKSTSRILFTGDMSVAREAVLEPLEQFTVLKVGHHGSKTSSSDEFLQQVRPSLAVISVGKGNKYGHPHKEALARLKSIGADISRTDESGCLKVELLPQGIRLTSSRIIRKESRRRNG